MASVTRTVNTPRGQVSYGESGDGPPIALFHSLLTDRTAFDMVVDDLPGRAISFDLPGFGGTGQEKGIDGFADAMAEAISTVCAGELPIAVVGNGLGAFVALGAAVRHPGMIRRLVLAGCGATFPEEARPAFDTMTGLVEEGGMEAVAPVALRRIFTEEYLESHPDAVAERRRVLVGTDPEAFVTACRALKFVDFTDGTRSVEAPVLIVVGDEDAATPPAMAEALNRLLPSSTLVTMPGIAHAPQLQDPDGFVAVVQKFLEAS